MFKNILLIFTVIALMITTGCKQNAKQASVNGIDTDQSQSDTNFESSGTSKNTQTIKNTSISNTESSNITSSDTTKNDITSVASSLESITSNSSSNKDTIKVKTTTTTTTKAKPKPLPPVVIPNVLKPLASGAEAFSDKNSTIDISNKSKGYFCAKYCGTNKKVKVMVQKDGKTYTYDLIKRNAFEVFPFQMNNGSYTISIAENISGTKYSIALKKTVNVSLSNSLLPFLYPNQQVNFYQSSPIVSKAAQVCRGKKTDLEKIGAIFDYVTKNVTYDYAEAKAVLNGSIKMYCPDPDEVLRTKKGICYDYASLFAAMARSQGIATRLVKGPVGKDNLYHAWNQVYVKKAGWINVYVKLKNTGYRTLDATFYAGSNNKKTTASNFSNSSYYRVDKIY